MNMVVSNLVARLILVVNPSRDLHKLSIHPEQMEEGTRLRVLALKYRAFPLSPHLA
jgi:hypothetical protein